MRCSFRLDGDVERRRRRSKVTKSGKSDEEKKRCRKKGNSSSEMDEVVVVDFSAPTITATITSHIVSFLLSRSCCSGCHWCSHCRRRCPQLWPLVCESAGLEQGYSFFTRLFVASDGRGGPSVWPPLEGGPHTLLAADALHYRNGPNGVTWPSASGSGSARAAYAGGRASSASQASDCEIGCEM